jgi:hypothetical protein
MTMMMKVFGSVLATKSILFAIGGAPAAAAFSAAAAGATTMSSSLPAEWTTPLKEGAKVPDVTFHTRTRIESNDPNPFDWKCTYHDIQYLLF